MKWLRVIALIIGVGMIIGVGISTIYRSGPHQFGERTWGSKIHRTDFTVYHEAGRAILAGTNIYKVKNPRGWVYQYLPAFALAFVPLAPLNVFWASLIWYLLSVAMFVHTLWLSVRLARKYYPNHRCPDFWVGALTAILILWPTLSALARGQASIMLMWLVTWSVWLHAQGRPWRAGLALAGAIVLKIFPALLMLYWAAKRQWGMVTATMVWLFVLIWVVPSAVLGPRVNHALLHQWVTKVAMPANQPDQSTKNFRYSQMINPRLDRNQSVQAVTIRWVALKDLSREGLARRLAMGMNLVLLLTTLWICRKTRPQRQILEVCAVLPLMLFIAPVSWTHNYTLLVLPLAVALTVGYGEGTRPLKWALVGFAIFVLLAMTVKPCHTFGALLGGTLLLWGSFAYLLATCDDSLPGSTAQPNPPCSNPIASPQH
jgi:hypothetical protein